MQRNGVHQKVTLNSPSHGSVLLVFMSIAKSHGLADIDPTLLGLPTLGPVPDFELGDVTVEPLPDGVPARESAPVTYVFRRAEDIPFDISPITDWLQLPPRLRRPELRP